MKRLDKLSEIRYFVVRFVFKLAMGLANFKPHESLNIMTFSKFFKHTGLVFSTLSLLFVSSCELSQNYLKHDRDNEMVQQDYRDALAPRETEINQEDASGDVPPLMSSIAQPDSNYKPMPLVSVSVNQTVPLKDVIYEIASQADYDVELDPRIRGSIIFSAKNRPLDEVIDRIANIAGLRYKFKDDMLRVEIDTPYHETYKINYLTLTRTNNSSISNGTSVVSGSGSDAGSNFKATNESVIDFWQELEENLTQIVESNRDSNRLATQVDPSITVADANPAPVTPLTMDENGNISDNGPDVQVQAPDAVLNVNSLPVDDQASGNDSEEDPFAARFSLNRQAGLISVFAPERLHKKVSSYLDELKRQVSAQVLIEAKVLEVSLNDDFSAGIDWSQVDIGLFGGTGAMGFGPSSVSTLVRGVLEADDTLASNSRVLYSKGNFSAAVDALSRFGTVHALASPRLTVMNNQSAVLNVAQNVVYFSVDVDRTEATDTTPAVTTFDTDALTVPEGVLINVQPAIDQDTRTVSMAIRPTVTTITSFTNDPNPELAAVGVLSPVPNVNVQEFDSIINVNSGQAVVLGGLIQDRSESTTNNVPVLGEVPFIGGLFRNQQDSLKKTELVVFLKATIIDSASGTIHNTDKDLYRTFANDRRPFDL